MLNVFTKAEDAFSYSKITFLIYYMDRALPAIKFVSKFWVLYRDINKL